MKHFKEYLAENERVYNYRIKIAGDTPKDLVRALGEKLRQFDVVKMSAPKTTPVMVRLADFPAIENESCTHMDVEFRYPAIEPQIQQIAQLLGIDPNRVCMLTVPYEDSYDKEAADVEKQNKDLLTSLLSWGGGQGGEAGQSCRRICSLRVAEDKVADTANV